MIEQKKKSIHPKSLSTKLDLILEEVSNHVYEESIAAICLEVACGIHQKAKTGELKLSEIRKNTMSPSSVEHIFGVSNKQKSEKRLKGRCPNHKACPTRAKNYTSNGTGFHQLDIWGRIPPKEPINRTRCPNCVPLLACQRYPCAFEPFFYFFAQICLFLFHLF